MAGKNVPVTIVSGFAGAGKTSFIEHLKRTMRARRPLFLFDDGERDLFGDIEKGVNLEGADSIIIECAPNLEPFFVAEHLTDGDDLQPPPRGIRVDTLVTIVDASNFVSQVNESADLSEFELAFDHEDDRAVSEILIEQVEFADVIVLNKTDMVAPRDLALLDAVLHRLNPRAKVVKAVRGVVDPTEVVGTGLFHFEETDDGAGWLAELQGDFDSMGKTGRVSSFTYIDRRPFHPLRFNELLSDFHVEGLVRAKGSVWVATRHHEIGVWSLAGKASILSYGGAWFAATPARDWPADERERAEIMKEWVPPFGDRRQEIAFIGIDLDAQSIRQRLEEALLTYQEMRDGPDSWYSIPDPLPDWHVET
jgi:G3E family GTPase